LKPEDLKQKLDEVAAEIFEYVVAVKGIKDYFETIPREKKLGNKGLGIASPYLNLRDALFHFNKMYDAAHESDDLGFIRQWTCIEEHLNRGLKDFATYVCSSFYIRIIHKMMETHAKSVNSDNLLSLRRIYHGLKNLVVEIRLEGQSLKHYKDSKNRWLPKLVDLIIDFDRLLNRNAQLKSLYNNLCIEIF
jgi:hypothetical protein